MTHKWIRIILPIGFGLTAAQATAMLLSAMWRACDSASHFAQGWSLLVAVPESFVAATAASMVANAAAMRIPLRRGRLLIAVAFSTVVTAATILAITIHAYGSPDRDLSDDISCHNGAPTWWPLPR